MPLPKGHGISYLHVGKLHASICMEATAVSQRNLRHFHQMPKDCSSPRTFTRQVFLHWTVEMWLSHVSASCQVEISSVCPQHPKWFKGSAIKHCGTSQIVGQIQTVDFHGLQNRKAEVSVTTF